MSKSHGQLAPQKPQTDISYIPASKLVVLHEWDVSSWNIVVVKQTCLKKLLVGLVEHCMSNGHKQAARQTQSKGMSSQHNGGKP